MEIKIDKEWFEKWGDDFEEGEIGAGSPDILFVPYDDNDFSHVEGNLIDSYHFCEEDLICKCDDCERERKWVELKYRQDHL